MRLAPLLLPLILTACIDADVTIAFVSETEVTTSGELRLGRELFDMLGKTPEAACEGGTGALTETDFTCTQTKTMTLDDFIAEAGRKSTGTPEDLTTAVRVEKLPDNQVRVTLDFADLLKDRPGAPSAAELQGMAGLLKGAVAGHSFVINVTGPAILDTTGTLSEDGLTATKVLPVATFLDPSGDFGPAFVTTLDLAPSCFLWVFC